MTPVTETSFKLSNDVLVDTVRIEAKVRSMRNRVDVHTAVNKSFVLSIVAKGLWHDGDAGVSEDYVLATLEALNQKQYK